jgi:hypothetical protein
MVDFLIKGPPQPVIHEPGKADFDVIKLNPWTWSKPDIIQQLAPKPRPSEPILPGDKPDPELHVSPIAYNTGFKNGQLIKLSLPAVRSSFI